MGDRNLKLTINNTCNLPHRTLVVDREGECFICTCEAWLPISVGNITTFNRLEDVWTSPAAIALQADVDSKKFTHCAVDRCGVTTRDINVIEFTGRKDSDKDCYYVSINIDDSCNLRCPSCRPNAIMNTEGRDYDRRLRMVTHLAKLLENFDQPTHIVMSGNGDPLASAIMRPLLHNYKPKDKHTIRLFTNGLLLAKQLTDNSIVNNITQYFISIDAGSKDVYEQVRLGGNHDMLLKNFEFLRDLVKTTKAHVLLKFVLQKDNYKDQEQFIKLAQDYNFEAVINRLEDWDTWRTFGEHDVIGNVDHPEHLDAVAELRRVYDLYSDSVQFNPSLAALCQTK
jgi:molybdenum cofactor biosynthesis enzyme MoaA